MIDLLSLFVRTWLSRPSIIQLTVFFVALPLPFLVSCSQAPIEQTIAIEIANPSPLPAESPSIIPSLAPQPTATLLPSPVPTIKLSPTTCPHSYFFLPAPPSCPNADPLTSQAAEQPFEGGVMIWIEASDSIFVFYEDGRWQRFDDTWTEDQPQSDSSFLPPAERFQPIRGFGKVWRENLNVRDLLGWALGPELGFDSMIQQQAGQLDNPRVLYLLTFNGQVFALTNPDLGEGDWVIAAS